MARQLLLLARAVAAIAIAPHYPLVGHPPLAGPRVRTKARERFTEFVAQRSGLLLIDVENVRGKTGFVLGHEELLRRVGGWAMRCGLHGRVALVVDHGSVAEAFLLKESGLSVAFAGPAQTADDVLVRTVPARGALVVTADGQLGRRCRRRASDGGGSVSLAPPSLLLDALGVDASAAGLAQAAAEAAAAEAAATAARTGAMETMIVTVVLSVPLSALALSVGGGGTRLLCRVPRHHAPLGVSPDAPLQLEFDELWRCAAAKSQLEAACTAARAEQHRKLVSMLGTAGPQAGEKAIQRA